MMEYRYLHIANGCRKDCKEIVLALLQQCKDEGLTFGQTLFALELAKQDAERMAMNLLLNEDMKPR